MYLFKSDAWPVQVGQATGVNKVRGLVSREPVTEGAGKRRGSLTEHPDDPAGEGCQEVSVVVGDDGDGSQCAFLGTFLDTPGQFGIEAWAAKDGHAPADQEFHQIGEAVVAVVLALPGEAEP